MTTQGDHASGTPLDLSSLLFKLERLELENKLLTRNLLVSDFERQKAHSLNTQLLAERATLLKAVHGSGCEEVSKALGSTRKMLQSIFETIPAYPTAPEAETE